MQMAARAVILQGWWRQGLVRRQPAKGLCISVRQMRAYGETASGFTLPPVQKRRYSFLRRPGRMHTGQRMRMALWKGIRWSLGQNTIGLRPYLTMSLHLRFRLRMTRWMQGLCQKSFCILSRRTSRCGMGTRWRNMPGSASTWHRPIISCTDSKKVNWSVSAWKRQTSMIILSTRYLRMAG